jgi:hypothetical protein
MIQLVLRGVSLMKDDKAQIVPAAPEPLRPSFLSARAARNPNLSTEELETAEAEAFEWAKRVNRC